MNKCHCNHCNTNYIYIKVDDFYKRYLENNREPEYIGPTVWNVEKKCLEPYNKIFLTLDEIGHSYKEVAFEGCNGYYVNEYGFVY